MQVFAGFAVLIFVTVTVWAVIAFGYLGVERLMGWPDTYTALAVAFLYAPLIAVTAGLVATGWFVQRLAHKKGRPS
ncbi:hypothetical protein IZ6_20690 [Terrihabitans soli]|uniref:Uncharacterized protein n=1 Tax=Terrihabitans soli TaxID=708113 RepID=A0A6S6QLP5_9HYPH|nr:hypothetical protein [Terrihabitans soli]BCJ91334.1 hypothetical protein IZ6_20690 [Terrihabitans soli]